MIGYILLVIAALGAAAAVIYFVIKNKKRKEEYNNQFDFTTKYGTRVKLSPRTKDISKEVFEGWTDSVVGFWEENKNWGKEKSYKIIGKTAIFVYDEPYLNRAGIKVNGITFPAKYEIEIAALPKINITDQTIFDRVESLFRHETSHVITGFVGGVPFDNEGHHKLFAEFGLGA